MPPLCGENFASCGYPSLCTNGRGATDVEGFAPAIFCLCLDRLQAIPLIELLRQVLFTRPRPAYESRPCNLSNEHPLSMTTTTTRMTTTGMATSRKSGAVFATSVMASVANMASSIPRFIRLKVVEWLHPAFRHRPFIAVTRIVAVINVAIEAMRTVEPWAGSNENPANEPVRPIVAVGSTAIRGIIEVPVWAHRRDTNVNRHLSWCYRHTTHQGNRERRESERLPIGHHSPGPSSYRV